VKEWRRAVGKRGAWDDVGAMRSVTPRTDTYQAPPPGELPAWLRRSRDITTSPAMLSQGAETILVLQRNNRLLRSRFGLDWADAASVVFEEAQRRGASPVSIARVLTAGLRRDARGGDA
jgi:hypothetical protein